MAAFSSSKEKVLPWISPNPGLERAVSPTPVYSSRQESVYSSYPSIYLPYALQLQYYPGVSQPCLPHSAFPVCPVPTHPVTLGGVPREFRPGPCHLARSQEELLASDIAMATRQDEDGDTPLHIAVVQEDSAMVDKLIQLLQLGRKDLDIYNNLRQTPLHLAVITKQFTIVRKLVTHGASGSLLDRNGQTAVHLACEHTSLDCLQALLLDVSHQRPDLEIRNYQGYTPLHVSVNSYQKEIVEFLLEQGADIDAVDIKSGKTPLVHAVENNCIDMVRLLLQHGANVNLQTYSGNTALHCSSGRGFLEVVKVLLKNGADSSIKNCHNDTSLMVAKNKKVIDILRGKACRPLPQPLSNQRAPCSVIKECPSPGSKSNSPLSTSYATRCLSPGVDLKASPQPMDTCSPPPSHRSPEAQLPSWRRSPPVGVANRSHSETVVEQGLTPSGLGEMADCLVRSEAPRPGSVPGCYHPQPAFPWTLCHPAAAPSAFRTMREEEALRFPALRPCALRLLAPPEGEAHLPQPPHRNPELNKPFRDVWLEPQARLCGQSREDVHFDLNANANTGKGES
ncbi:B-cell lymphoma 3 protein [Chiloscyllium punctatum]